MLKLMTAAVVLLLGASQVLAGDPCGPGHMRTAKVQSGVLELRWEGRLADQMSGDIAAEYDRSKKYISAVSLSLHSCGGSLLYVQRVVSVLEQIKAAHELVTVVDRGATCASACVPIFLAGKRRAAALTSAFYFHPVVMQLGDPGTDEAGERMRVRAELTDDVLTRYFVSAGISEDWLQYLRRSLRTHDLWQSGRDLWESKSGIVTETIDNLEPREYGPVDLPTGTICGVKCRG